MAWENAELEITTGSVDSNYYSTYYETLYTATSREGEYYANLFSGLTFNLTVNYTSWNSSMSVGQSLYLLGDSTNGIEIYKYNDRAFYLYLRVNGSRIAGYLAFISSQYQARDSLLSLFVGIDEENQKATLFLYTQCFNTGYWDRITHSIITAWEYTNNANVYSAVKGLIPVLYNWQSVPSISGKNGILSLAHVADDSILTGDNITNIPLENVVLPSSASFATLMSNVPRGTRAPIVYAGNVDHLDGKRSTGLIAAYDLILNVVTDKYTLSAFGAENGYLGFIIDNDNEVAKIVNIMPHTEAGIQTGWDLNVGSSDADDMYYTWLFIQGHMHNEDNPEVNEADPGTDPTYQQDIAVTGITKPSYGAIDTGFSKMYRMSAAQLKSLSDFLWSNSFIDVVTKFFNDPREIIVGLSIMPVTPTTGSSEEVQAGGISTGVYGLPLTDQYVFDTYGFAEVKAEKGNFLDYNPFTKVTAHLPFVGEHSLDVNDVVGKQLTLKYIFDFLTGSCVAEIDVNGKPRYFFGGACGMQVPTSSEDFGRMYSSILSAGATLGGTLATIATGGLTAPLAIGAATNMLANGMNGSPTVQFSSGSGSVNGMIGCKTAFLVIEKPKEKIVGSQQGYLGRPSFMLRTLSDCSGYTKCLNVHLDNVPCTATERAEIERLLLDGVRIKAGSTTPTYTPTTASDHGLIFLKCTSDMDVIGKSWDEEHTLTVEGKLMFDQDMLTPKFVLQADTLAYNYCYIPDFGRFYYVTKQLIKTGSMTEIHLQCDVLQSWKTQILSNKAVIERSADNDNVNMYFSDNMYWTQANKEVKTVPFTKANGDELVFEIPSDNYILTIAGGS